jgi:hypothetical protein
MPWFTLAVWAWMAVGVITLLVLVLTKIRAPYGRHANEKWGKMIPNKWGWVLMELPALLLTPLLAAFGPSEKDAFAWLLIGLWTLHYTNRTLIFPFRLRTNGKKMPLTIVYSAWGFNLMNGLVNGYYLGFLYTPDPGASWTQPLILLGIFLFFAGFGINMLADTQLINLRKKHEGYQIPRGWLFNIISCPNHFGEIIEWIGFALIAGSLPAWSFAVWTFCNLLPRTLNHHAWYRENFVDYPKNRKAVIPFVL